MTDIYYNYKYWKFIGLFGYFFLSSGISEAHDNLEALYSGMSIITTYLTDGAGCQLVAQMGYWLGCICYLPHGLSICPGLPTEWFLESNGNCVKIEALYIIRSYCFTSQWTQLVRADHRINPVSYGEQMDSPLISRVLEDLWTL